MTLHHSPQSPHWRPEQGLGGPIGRLLAFRYVGTPHRRLEAVEGS